MFHRFRRHTVVSPSILLPATAVLASHAPIRSLTSISICSVVIIGASWNQAIPAPIGAVPSATVVQALASLNPVLYIQNHLIRLVMSSIGTAHG